MRKVVISLLLITVSCNYIFNNQGDKYKGQCKEFSLFVKEKWNRKSKDGYYEYDEDFLLKIQKDYRNCIIGLTQEEIFELFGEPVDKTDIEQSYYFLNKECLDNLPTNCKMLIFYFDIEKKQLFDYRVLPYVSHD